MSKKLGQNRRSKLNDAHGSEKPENKVTSISKYNKPRPFRLSDDDNIVLADLMRDANLAHNGRRKISETMILRALIQSNKNISIKKLLASIDKIRDS